MPSQGATQPSAAPALELPALNYKVKCTRHGWHKARTQTAAARVLGAKGDKVGGWAADPRARPPELVPPECKPSHSFRKPIDDT